MTTQNQSSVIEKLSARKRVLLETWPPKNTTGNPDSEEKIVLLHIPKTAGTSLSNMLFEVFSPGEILTDFSSCHTDALGHFIRKDVELLLRGLSKHQLEKCKIFSGHLPVELERSFDFTAHYISFFRNPVDRLISGFLYGTKKIQNLSQEYIMFGLHRSISASSSPGFDNSLTRLLSGSDVLTLDNGNESSCSIGVVTESDRRVAINRLFSRFCFIGLTERFDDSCRMLFALLGKKYSKQLRLNETGSRFFSSDIPVCTLRAIERRHNHDIAVYAAGCEIFNEYARLNGMEYAKPYLRKTFGGAFSSGDYAHTVSCDEAFGDKTDGVWLSFTNTNKKINEYIGFEFDAPRACGAVEIQMASLENPQSAPFIVEASDDYFYKDVRHIGQIAAPTDYQRHVVQLPAIDLKAKYWRLSRRQSSGDTPLAIAFLSFAPVSGISPIRNMDMVLSKLISVKEKFNEETYVSMLEGASAAHTA